MLAALENIVSNQKVIYTFGLTMIDMILPSLFKKFSSSSNDVKFTSNKIFCNLIITYIKDKQVFDLQSARSRAAQTTSKLDEIIRQFFLPRFPKLLKEPEPNPLFAV